MVEIAIEVAKGRVPVIAGAGSNSTEEAIDLARHAKQAGADAALVVTPYYNKPTQEGMYLHFKAIADAVDLPMIIYNIPPRSVVDMSVETMARLAQAPEHRRREGRDREPGSVRCTRGAPAATTSASCRARTTPRSSFLAAGGDGCISVTANVAPRLCARCRMPGRTGGSTRRWRSRTGWCRCTTRCSPRPARRR